MCGTRDWSQGYIFLLFFIAALLFESTTQIDLIVVCEMLTTIYNLRLLTVPSNKAHTFLTVYVMYPGIQQFREELTTHFKSLRNP